MEKDKEVEAMSAVADALAPLEPDIVERVIRWAAEKYKVVPTLSCFPNEKGALTQSISHVKTVQTLADFETFSDLYDAANPQTDAERVLVGSFWFQVIKNEVDLESQKINKELTNVGHRIGHMPHTLRDLRGCKPRLIIQLQKQGKARQARLKFKLTTEGIKKVKGMLESNQN